MPMGACLHAPGVYPVRSVNPAREDTLPTPAALPEMTFENYPALAPKAVILDHYSAFRTAQRKPRGFAAIQAANF
jgi:hypothetical protein